MLFRSTTFSPTFDLLGSVPSHAHSALDRGTVEHGSRVADERTTPSPAYDAGMDDAGRLLLMAVHAHPDDETISMGGTLSRYAAANSIARGETTDVIVVTGTRGELGEIVIPERDTPEEHERLGETRMGEIAAAMRALGVSRWENLGYRDRKSTRLNSSHPSRSRMPSSA